LTVSERFRNGIRIWSSLTSQIVKTLTGHTSRVLSLVILQDGLLASCSADKTIRICIWSTNDDPSIRGLSFHITGES
jgi:WD40 repeat protein